MKMTRFFLFTATLLLALWVFLPAGRAAGATLDVCPSGCSYTSIQAAIDAAQPGDTISIAAGTYTGNLAIHKSIVLTGAGVGATILQAGAGYAITIDASNVSLSGFSLLGGSGTTYGIKASGASNLSLQNLAVSGTGRSGIDLNGMDGAQMVGVSSSGAVSGVGIGLSDSHNVQMSAITTSGNAWGGIGVYTYGRYYPGGTSHIALSGSNSLGELNPVYVQVDHYLVPGQPYPVTDLTLPGFDYVVTNLAAPTYTWYQVSLQSSQNFLSAGSPAFRSGAVIRPAAGGDAIVLNGMTIQAAIDASSAGGTVQVYPGSYSETAVNRRLYDNSGPYQFGLFIGQDKAGLSVVGVDSNGQPVTDPALTAALVTTNATNGFGPSGIFVEGDGVTISGLEILPNVAGNNKTIEVLGDDFSLLSTHINVAGGSVYLNDWRFNPATNTAHLQSYTITNNLFDLASTLDIASGAGATGPLAGRVISGNRFNSALSGRATISFSGTVPDIAWYTYPVGGAIIENNTFSGGAQYIRARGAYDNTQFDWAGYWNNNIFDRAVITGVGAGLPAQPRAYEYMSGSYHIPNTRRIGATLQGGVDIAEAGDTVLAKAGTYAEQVIIAKNITLQGAGVGQTQLRPPAALVENPPAPSGYHVYNLLTVKGGATAAVNGLTLRGPLPVSSCSDLFSGVYVHQGANLNLSQSEVLDIHAVDNAMFGCQAGLGIRVGEYGRGTPGSVVIDHVVVSGYQKGGIVADGAGVNAVIRSTTVTGNGNETRTAQNGIQISRGATGSVEASTVSGNRCDAAGCGAALDQWQSAGIMLYLQGSGVEVLDNTVDGNDMGIFAYSSGPALVQGNLILNSRYEGVYLGQGVATVQNNDILGPGNYAVAVVADNGDTANAQAVLSNNRTEGYQTALLVEDLNPTDAFLPLLSGVENSFAALAAGQVNHTTQAPNLRRNWWGSKHGPTIASNPGGNGLVLNGPVLYDPWLCDGTDAQPAARGFQPFSTSGCTANATRLVFTAQPAFGLTDEPFATQPVVRAVDDADNLAVNFNGQVLLSIGINPTGGVLVGTPYVKAVEGIATFSGLYINKAGSGYTLIGSSGSKDWAISQAFNVTVRAANLSVTLGASANPVVTDASFSYTASVTNAGPQAAKDAALVFNIPAGVQFVDASGSGWTCVHSGASVNCSVASLASGVTAPVVIQVKAPSAPGSILAAVNVSSSVGDPDMTNNAAELTVQVESSVPTLRYKMYLPVVIK